MCGPVPAHQRSFAAGSWLVGPRGAAPALRKRRTSKVVGVQPSGPTRWTQKLCIARPCWSAPHSHLEGPPMGACGRGPRQGWLLRTRARPETKLRVRIMVKRSGVRRSFPPPGGAGRASPTPEGESSRAPSRGATADSPRRGCRPCESPPPRAEQKNLTHSVWIVKSQVLRMARFAGISKLAAGG